MYHWLHAQETKKVKNEIMHCSGLAKQLLMYSWADLSIVISSINSHP
jgi:hypothetical protein